MQKELKNLKNHVYLTIGLIVLAVVILLYIFSRSFTTIRISPTSASLVLNGQQVAIKSNGAFRAVLTPGLHTLTVEADGHVGYNETVLFSRGFSKQLSINLPQYNEPLTISKDAGFLQKSKNFNEIYYLSNQALYKSKLGLDESGKITVIEEKQITAHRFNDISEIIFSADEKLALIRKKNGEISLFDFMKYDFVNQTETLWGGNDIKSIDWSPDNNKIAYVYAPPGGEVSLILSDVNNQNIFRAVNLKEEGIINPLLHWSPDGEWLIIIPRDTNEDNNKIYLFNAYSRTLKQITDFGGNLDAMFSPDGNKILYSNYGKNDQTPVTSSLSIMDRDGKNQRSLDIQAEVSKSIWSNDSKKVVIATFDKDTKNESVFSFDTEAKKRSGFSIRNLDKMFIRNLTLSDDERIVIYETNSGIFALNVK